MAAGGAKRSWTGKGVAFVTGWSHAVPAGRCELHTHREWELIYHARGTGRSFLADGSEFEFEAGSAELVPAGLRHGQDTRTSGEDVCIHFAWRLPRGERPPGWVCVRRLADPCLRHEMEALVAEHPGSDRLRREVADHRAAALVLGVLRAAAEAQPVPRRMAADHARRAYEHIRENCCSMGSVEEVAEAVGIGPDHLRHAFRAHFGMSPKAWMIEARLRRARSLLASSALPLKAVAGMCGFANQRHFSTSFRRAAGVPPGAYRRSLER